MKKFFLFSLILLVACLKQVPEKQRIPSQFMKIFEKLPPENISSLEKISFDFTYDIPEAEIRQEINAKDVFQFIPKVEGRAWWEKRDVLVFLPFSNFEPGKEYKCKVNLSILSSTLKYYPPLEISLKVFQNEVLSFSNLFEKDIASADASRQSLNVSFIMTNRKLKEEEAKGGIIVLLNGEKIEYSLRKVGDTFKLKSSFSTPENGGKIAIKFDSKVLGIPKDLSYELPLAPIKKFKVENLDVIWEKGEPKIYINFSHPLKEDEEFDTFIRIEPNLELNYYPQGNLLKISGDLKHGTSYKLTVLAGLKNFLGEKLQEEQNFSFRLSDFPPEIKIVKSKVYLSSKSNKNLRFKTININQVNIVAYYIPIQNLVFFLQDFYEEQSSDYYIDYNRFGKIIYSDKIKIPAEKNKWIEQDLNLNIPENLPDKGVFGINFNFQKEDVLWECKAEGNDYDYDYDYYGDYYNNPCRYSYYYNKGKANVVAVISDIGMLAIREKNKWNLWAYNVLTGEPESGVEIEAMEYQNLLVDKKTTNKDGYASFEDKNISFFIGKKGKNLSFIKTSSSSPPLEPFDLSGSSSSSKGLNAFVYTERGVYRPSDDIHLTAIVREDSKKPVDLPLKCLFQNPLNQKAFEGINSQQINGVYYFKLKTDIDSPTGIWNANLYIGEEMLASHPVKVEMIVPPKIKPEIKLEKDKIFNEDFPLSLDLSSNYLFGAPSSGLPFNLKVKMTDTSVSFPKFKEFKFSTPYKKYTREEKIIEGALDDQGKASAKWSFIKEETTPNFVKADFLFEVTEKGGRPAYDKKTAIIYPYLYYIGIKIDENKTYKSGENVSIPFISVDKNGNPVSGRELEAKVYFTRYYWWWEIRNYKEIISSPYIEVKNTFTLKSKAEPSTFEVPITESYGSYFVEIRDKGENESIFFNIPVRYWGEEQKEVGGSYLKFEGAKENYNIGDYLDIDILTPQEGSLFYSIVKGDRILFWDINELKSTNTKVKVKITEEMVPSSYLFVSAIQKLGSKNDMPLRSYTIIPFNVIPDGGKLEMEVICPEKIKPKEKFPVKIKLLNNKEAVVTLAVVDSGLINLTQEKTPDPYSFFYKKLRWGLKYQDSFDYFYEIPDIPAEYTYKIGGEGVGQKLLTSPVKSNPFPPVVFFKGPIQIKGEEEIEVELPNYLGEVKVIVVGTWNKSYGSCERFIKVSDDLIPYGTFPRAVAPGDEFEIPLQLFIQETKKEKIKIEIITSKHFEILSEKKQEVPFEEGEKMVYFYAKAKENEIGEGFIKINLKAKKNYEVFQIVPIHPINSYISKDDFYTISPQETKEIKVPVFGFPSSANAEIILSRFENIPLKSIYDRVVRYPFGCIEQTSSKLFATLFLRDLILLYGEIFENLNKSYLDSILIEGFQRLQSFTLPEGNFTFWPGERSPASDWTNVYVAHLLVEANKRGFSLQNFVNKTIEYQKNRARARIEDTRTQAYRLFVLSLNNTPDFSSMNLLKENYLTKMKDQEKLILSGAYALSKDYISAKEILKGINNLEKSSDYLEYFYGNSGVYGNYLFFLSKIDKDLASNFFSKVSSLLGKQGWWSTHDIGWFCAGYSSYLNSLKGISEKIKVTLYYPDGKEEKIDKELDLYSINLKNYLEKVIKIKNEGKGVLFLDLSYSGIPLEVPKKAENRNMNIKTTFLDENGGRIDEKNLKMGSVIYEKIELDLYNAEKYIAISQVLPGGWEPINLRLLNLELPEWASSYTSTPSYTDIRDDRVNVFIDNPGYTNHFVFYIPIKVVTKGNFILPPTTAQAMYNPEFYAILPHGYIKIE